jgi:hypothetical protein
MATTPGIPNTINVNPNIGNGSSYSIAYITKPIPSNQIETFAILHELGHLLGVLPVDSGLDDGGKQQRINNDNIQENCFPNAG